MKRLRVGVIGHWRANIGHDLMALGVEHVLQSTFGDKVSIERIEHHRPLDIYPWWFLPRHLPWLRHGRGGGIARAVKGYLNRADVSVRLWPMTWVGRLDLAICCGGPLITPWISRGDLGLMYQHMFGAFQRAGVPLLNLSVGAAYPRENIPSADVLPADADFLERMFAYSSLTTVRDDLARHLCLRLGRALPLVPDTGFVAGEELVKMHGRDTSPKYIVLNAQRYGANEDWGQGVDDRRWLATLAELARRLAARAEVLFVCHSESEMRLAAEILPGSARVRPQTVRDYARIVGGAVAGVCTRIHSGIALASVGLPVIGVGTDSRLGTLEALGSPTYYVKEVDVDILETAVDGALRSAAEERDRLLALRSSTRRTYGDLLVRALDRA